MLPKFDGRARPTGSLSVLNDRSTSIRQAVHDVQLTLRITVGLVVLVIFLFLRRLSATIIPALAVPISLDRHVRRDVSARLLDRQHLAARR